MTKRETSASDFIIAPRKQRAESSNGTTDIKKIENKIEDNISEIENDISSSSIEKNSASGREETKLISVDKSVQRERSTSRALRQEASRLRFQDLKQKKDRESKHYVNCPLDYDTKQRLAKASIDNQIKMTVIIKAAIDQFLRDNGY
ncbi:hypothetical protein NAC44_20530 [Allorhizobium sp. BGMRC 0089]|uniref:hypothetical protein n=1 Tax=Allorhizobium sonneratiae TaxID=2934936 RepID=UPI0020337FC7|nr:hypothetical protein [Allorhizobium sonneratiae]MCM2294717.1 hypothetical protein [Allorhizobium sonneratiae]